MAAQPTNQIEWLIDIQHSYDRKETPKDVPKIKLNQFVSKLGFFYEKFRNVIDYNEEHLVRRNSLARLLKREILFLQESRPAKIGKNIVYEFIRAKYLPNNTLPETIIGEIAEIVEKYLAVLTRLRQDTQIQDDKLADWLINLASCEINEKLAPTVKQNAMVNLMYSHLNQVIQFVQADHIDGSDRQLQIYIACLKNLFKADRISIHYQLLKIYFPNWTKIDASRAAELVPQLLAIKKVIDHHLRHPLGFEFGRIVRPQAVFFAVIQEIISSTDSDKLREVFSNPDLLEEKIEEIVRVKNYQTRSRLIGTIFRVIIYILLTKTILAFVFEIPYEYFILGKVDWAVLGVNVFFHPLLMFGIAATIRVPGVRNTRIITEEIKKIVYGRERKIIFKPKKSLAKGSFSYTAFNAVYLVMFFISFGLVVSILRFLNFNLVSSVLFIFFLSVVSFFGFRLRNLAKRYSVVPRRDNFINFLVDFITLPIIRVGRFFSVNFSRINVFLFILDFIIETPFKILIEFLEKTVSFINEKREEIIE